MKLIVGGYARHGKDTFCEMLGIPFKSSSEVALEEVIWPQYNWLYDTKTECFNDRIHMRPKWFKAITDYNTPDRTRLAQAIFEGNDIYCGIRNREEFMACKEKGLFDLSIWIDASGRMEREDLGSCTVRPEDFDMVITNNGTELILQQKADIVKSMIKHSKSDVSKLIVDWADSVWPERTITNAISKLVLEEIPEYLMAQEDPMELADLGILLYDIANLAGVDLDRAIREKMVINKRRTWHIDAKTGLMNHDIGDIDDLRL